MLDVQSAQLLIEHRITMPIIFENTQTKNTKEFVFTVRANADGSYEITSVSYHILHNSVRRETSRKEWRANSLNELRSGVFMKTRQGKMFADSQFWIDAHNS